MDIVTHFSAGSSLQQEGVGVSSTMVVEKQKLDSKVKEMKNSVLVDLALRRRCLGVMGALNSPKTPLSSFSDGRSVH